MCVVNNCFTKNHRLLNAEDFSQVFNQADYKVSNRYFLILAKRSSFAFSRLGIVVARKNIPRAVNRNKIKRLVREYFRVNNADFGTIDLVILPRKGLDALEKQEISHQLEVLFKDLTRKTTGESALQARV